MVLRLALPNPSPRTWWIIGAAVLGSAAVAGTAWWLVRRRRDQDTVFIPPMVWTPDATGTPQRVAEDPTICQRWKTGNDRIPWGPEHRAVVEAAVAVAFEENFEPYDSVQEARTVAFKITTAALREVCPTWPLPSLPSQLDAYKADPDLGFWWDAAWDAFYASAWQRVVAAGGGSL